MPWFKVDDKFHANVKVTKIPRSHRWSSIGLWTITAAWSADQLTDGFIPLHQFDEMGGQLSDAEQLCIAELWSEVEGGFQFNNWAKYQPTAAEVTDKLERLKETRSLAGKKGAAARWTKPGGKMANAWQDEVPEASNESVALAAPVPSRPDPTRPNRESVTDGKRISADFAITTEMREWFEAENLVLDIDLETAKFVDYYLAAAGNNGLRFDWVATWRGWMRKAPEYMPANSEIDPWAGKQVFN